MKNILIIISISFISLYSCAQIRISNISELGRHTEKDVYYKDSNNFLNPFEGTWLYSSGNTSIKIIMRKQIKRYNGKYFEDRIIGEYQYIKNGVEIVNTLNRLNANSSHLINARHEIQGNFILNNCILLPLDDCLRNERRLYLSFSDPNSTQHYANIMLKQRVVAGQDVLKGFIVFSLTEPAGPKDRVIVDPDMPWQQEYVFVKQ